MDLSGGLLQMEISEQIGQENWWMTTPQQGQLWKHLTASLRASQQDWRPGCRATCSGLHPVLASFPSLLPFHHGTSQHRCYPFTCPCFLAIHPKETNFHLHIIYKIPICELHWALKIPWRALFRPQMTLEEITSITAGVVNEISQDVTRLTARSLEDGGEGQNLRSTVCTDTVKHAM